jgi:glutamate 5-kinase
MRVVVKIGTSSLTDSSGRLNKSAIGKLCNEIAALHHENHELVLVTSAAITAGLEPLNMVHRRPRDVSTLQAAASVGQSRLLHAYDEALAQHQVVAGQILLSPEDFFERRRYVNARSTLLRLIELRVVPIINENDALTDDEIRFGDNDRLAALVAHAMRADLLILLTDMAGLFTSDPRIDPNATLVEEVTESDREMEVWAGGSGSDRGSGGMASKLAAARMAAWTGVRSVIAAADRERVVHDALNGSSGVGTVVLPKQCQLPARKVWIAFALPSAGRIFVDDGARKALLEHDRSLLAAGVTKVEGEFIAGNGVELIGPDGSTFAKGVTGYSALELTAAAGHNSAEIADDVPEEVVHRDDLVVLL